MPNRKRSNPRGLGFGGWAAVGDLNESNLASKASRFGNGTASPFGSEDRLRLIEVKFDSHKLPQTPKPDPVGLSHPARKALEAWWQNDKPRQDLARVVQLR